MCVIEQAEVMTTTAAAAAKEREERELMTRCLEEVINPRDAPVFTSFVCIKEAVEGGGWRRRGGGSGGGDWGMG